MLRDTQQRYLKFKYIFLFAKHSALIGKSRVKSDIGLSRSNSAAWSSAVHKRTNVNRYIGTGLPLRGSQWLTCLSSPCHIEKH
jgi:hypothetical protein